MFFNPTIRVYNLRILLTALLTICVWAGLKLESDLALCGGILMGSIVVFVHHVVVVFPIAIPAVIDFVGVLVELGAGKSFIVAHRPTYQGHLTLDMIAVSFLLCIMLREVPINIAGFIVGIALLLSALFRFATLCSSPEKFYRKKFVFLGGCAQAHPSYTPRRIFLNRSLAGPLLRGESKIIIFARAALINGIMLGILITGTYYTLVAPIQAQIFLSLQAPQSLLVWDSLDNSNPSFPPQQNATVAIVIGGLLVTKAN